MKRDIDRGVTHALIFQRVGNDVDQAALIPINALGPIWKRQATVSDKLIATGKMKRIKKNHARNGSSPTIWLKDERTEHAHLVADVLWNWYGVQDLVRLPVQGSGHTNEQDDSVDDLFSQGYEGLGTDDPQRRRTERSSVRRDPAVRLAVLERSGGKCEHQSCKSTRAYDGYLDVHHILGADISDRVWNCVALCPNCHRDAHRAPNRDDLNAELLEYAERYRPRRGS
jgi:5-methylcytosine-specific restriction protein A